MPDPTPVKKKNLRNIHFRGICKKSSSSSISTAFEQLSENQEQSSSKQEGAPRARNRPLKNVEAIRLSKYSSDQEVSSNHQKDEKKRNKGRTKVEKKDNERFTPEVEAAMKDFCEANSFEVLQQECNNVAEQKGELKGKWMQNKEHCRGETPCLESTRVVLNTDLGGRDFYHANKIQIDKADREYILAQAPMANTLEDFWRMIFQETSTSIFVVCSFYEEGHESSEQFWPMGTGEYKYYGKMFINNKRTELNRDVLHVYTLEVLPDGCSNSLITTLYHCSQWKIGQPPDVTKLILRARHIIRRQNEEDVNVQTIVGSEGLNRSACYLAIDACITRLLRGHKTRAVEIIQEVRKQRYNALNIETLYYHVVQVVLDYIRTKSNKALDGLTAFNSELNRL